MLRKHIFCLFASYVWDFLIRAETELQKLIFVKSIPINFRNKLKFKFQNFQLLHYFIGER